MQITRKISYLLLFIIVSSYFVASLFELSVDECTGHKACYDFFRREGRLEVWNFEHVLTDFRHSLHFGLLILSDLIFGSYRILPLISSSLLILLAYFFTLRITGNPLTSLVSGLVLMSSNIFLTYDTSITYPSFWTLFFGFSTYLAITKWKASPVFWILSVPMKGLNAFFLPGLIGFVWFLGNEYRKKLIIVYCIIAAVSFVALYVLVSYGIINNALIDLHFNFGKFVQGFGSWANGFRQDRITFGIVIAVIPLLFVLRKIPYAKSLLCMMFGIILTSPILNGMSSYDSSWSYRWLPLVFFASISVGFVIHYIKELKTSFAVNFKKKDSHNPAVRESEKPLLVKPDLYDDDSY